MRDDCGTLPAGLAREEIAADREYLGLVSMAPLRSFRVQFHGSVATRTENVVEERLIEAPDLQEAARQVGELPWPDGPDPIAF